MTVADIDWLKTVVAEVGDRGVERPSQTIAPDRGQSADVLVAHVSSLSRDRPLVFKEIIAEGGMDRSPRDSVGACREVAVKAVREDRPEQSYAVELLREAWMTGALEHPNIVPVHDIVFDACGRPQVVLKRIDGRPLSEIYDPATRCEEPALRRSLEIFLQVASAIRFAHSRGILHRDIKPANVMIGPFGEVYVVDWGLAVTIGDDCDGRYPRAADEAERIVGTPTYMAPEMLGEKGAVHDQRTDIYLLGALLFELVCGAPLHRGAKMLAVLEHVRRGEPTFPADVPAELVKIIRKSLARDPANRHASADELRREVLAFLDHLSSARIAREAEQSLTALREVDDGDRSRIYHLFGECRFGFRAAIAAWEENNSAREGYRIALELMIEHELERGDAGAAAAFIAEHDAPPPPLADRVGRALAERAEKVARLAKLDADRDPRTGQRARLAVTLAMTIPWSLFPLALEFADVERRLSVAAFHASAVAVMGGWMAVLLVLGLLARRPLGATRFNRLAFASCIVGGGATFIFAVGARQLAIDPHLVPITAMLLWAICAVMGGATVDRRIYPIAVFWVAGFFVAAAWSGTHYYAMAASNLGAAITAIWAWGGRSTTQSTSDPPQTG